MRNRFSVERIAVTRLPATLRLLLGIVDFAQQAIEIDRPMLSLEMTGETDLGRQMAMFVQCQISSP